jgi:hypothetical protein
VRFVDAPGPAPLGSVIDLGSEYVSQVDQVGGLLAAGGVGPPGGLSPDGGQV